MLYKIVKFLYLNHGLRLLFFKYHLKTSKFYTIWFYLEDKVPKNPICSFYYLKHKLKNNLCF